jgi:glycosyltransferase involved in cell wall biosynthesis
MPAYNEAEGIEASVLDFLALPEVDEVVVVDNNSRDGTADLARRAGARVITEVRQGYGYACRAALAAGEGDYIILVEPDRTFLATDIYKFFAYAEEFDVVFGTRTSKTCIWSGSNMGLFLRYGNWAVAKLLEYLHDGPCLTDVGCTYKMFRRDSLRKIMGQFTVGASHFSPELMTIAIRSGLVCVEIPVHYRKRVGTSKITGQFWKTFRLGLLMTAMIIRCRFKSYPQVTSAADRDRLSLPVSHRLTTGRAQGDGAGDQRVSPNASEL